MRSASSSSRAAARMPSWPGATSRPSARSARATTKELLFTAELVDAPEAHRRGAVSAVLPLAEIERYVSDLAGSLAANAPLTLRTSKLAVLASLDARRAALGPRNEIVELAYL